MNYGDLVLTASIMGLNVAFLFTLLKRDARVHPGTALAYTIIIACGSVGLMLNHQWWPFFAQVVSAAEWFAMFLRSISPHDPAQS